MAKVKTTGKKVTKKPVVKHKKISLKNTHDEDCCDLPLITKELEKLFSAESFSILAADMNFKSGGKKGMKLMFMQHNCSENEILSMLVGAINEKLDEHPKARIKVGVAIMNGGK